MNNKGFGFVELIFGLVVMAGIAYFYVPQFRSLFGDKAGEGIPLVDQARDVTAATKEAAKKAEAAALKYKCEIQGATNCN